MHVLQKVIGLREQVQTWRQAGESVAFVPTMGNLHAGHLSLVDAAKRVADRVVVSIFVNPLQFSAGEDFSSYPRTQQQDRDKLSTTGIDVLFLPSVETIYPKPLAQMTRVEVPDLSDQLCGEFRPGHFVGVATIVAKLFHLVTPDIALFGEKDFQQLMVIRQMVDDLSMDVQILSVPTIRENDGLAMSSRNRYLSHHDREKAGRVYTALEQIENQLRLGNEDLNSLEIAAKKMLEQAGFEVQYVAIRCALSLELPQKTDHLVILIAATLGRTRLIDNRVFLKSPARMVD